MTPAHRDQHISTVVANIPLCRDHYRLVLHLDSFPPTRPGQFVQIACRDLNQHFNPEYEIDCRPDHPPDLIGQELISPLALLRRPFSLAGRRDRADGVELDVIFRVIGAGTDWLGRLKNGVRVHLLGPLGNHFTSPGSDGGAILVGGGVGIPPILYLSEQFAGKKAVAFCGALCRDLLPLTLSLDAPSPAADDAKPMPLIEEFSRHGIPAVISTDDGSYGFRGFITQALERYLDGIGARGKGQGARGEKSSSSPLAPLPSPLTIYTCGPEPMMKRVARIAADRGIQCQIAVERAMACGMGTCQSCVIRVQKGPGVSGQGQDWQYKLACTDGPIFRGTELLW